MTLSQDAVKALDLHRLAQVDSQLRELALQHMKTERLMKEKLAERSALRALIGQKDDFYVCPF